MLQMRARRRELILFTKHTLDCGFLNCSTPTTNGYAKHCLLVRGCNKQGSHYTYNIILRHVRETIIAVEKQLILDILSV
jgi:hypothetical protein